MLTVRGLVSEMGLKLTTGDAGADAPVRWVHITELPDPTPWLSGGELLLTTGIQLDTDENLDWFRDRIRETLVLAQAEALPVAATPLAYPLYDATVALAYIVDGLAPGEWRELTANEVARLRRSGPPRS